VWNKYVNHRKLKASFTLYLTPLPSPSHSSIHVRDIGYCRTWALLADKALARQPRGFGRLLLCLELPQTRAVLAQRRDILRGRPATVEAWTISGLKGFTTLTAAGIFKPEELSGILIRCLPDMDEYVIMDSINTIKTTALLHQTANGAVYHQAHRLGHAIVVRHVLGSRIGSRLLHILYVPRSVATLDLVVLACASRILPMKSPSVKDCKRVIAEMDGDYPAEWANAVRSDIEMSCNGQLAPLPCRWSEAHVAHKEGAEGESVARISPRSNTSNSWTTTRRGISGHESSTMLDGTG